MTLPTFWSLVTLPTSLGRVASDPLVFFLWPCSLKNTSHRILFLVVACDPTYLFGRVASDHFLALAIPKHLPWPDLHSDRIWPYSPTCHRKHGFCVAGATISMPLRCSPLTLYMLVGKCQIGFCVAGATILMPLRWSPLTLYMLVGKGRKWLTVTLCGRRSIFNASEKYFVTQCLATLVTLLAFCVEGAEFSMAPRSSLCIRLLVWQVQYFRHLREGHRDTARSSPWH